jgi:hypothetical protein
MFYLLVRQVQAQCNTGLIWDFNKVSKILTDKCVRVTSVSTLTLKDQQVTSARVNNLTLRDVRPTPTFGASMRNERLAS